MDIYTESSGVDTSPDMNSSVEINSPDRQITVQPRKLTFAFSPDLGPVNNLEQEKYTFGKFKVSPTKHPSLSPPYRKVRALRLFDTPATPKTIIQKSSNRLFIKSSEVDHELDILAKPIDGSTPLVGDRPRALPLHNKVLENVIQSANVNPFSPNGFLMHNKKRPRTQIGRVHVHNNSLPASFAPDYMKRDSDEDDYLEVRQAPKRLALQETNISRYKKEFIEISLIGVGEFGLVYKCLNRLDGCIYAIKRSIKPVAGSSFEKTALNEVWAHAVLGKHDNVVRYYSAWAEDNHMLIQNEHCNGGSLQSLLQKRTLHEPELKTLLLHIAEGLKYIHSNGLVHMDLKAGNIFLTKVPTQMVSSMDSCDDGFEDLCDDLDSNDYTITYKIGDLGHVTSVKHAQVEEGDCRYLPNEILQEDFKNLYKADIFSLGITLFEAAGGGPLPKNGPEWHNLRNGNVPNLPNLTKQFNDLIKIMTHPNPEKRPSSTSIFNHPLLNAVERKSKAQLSLELAMERQKNEILLRKLKETRKIIRSFEQSRTPLIKRSRTSPPIMSDRRLRSYTRKNLIPGRRDRIGLRDRNKNIIDERDF